MSIGTSSTDIRSDDPHQVARERLRVVRADLGAHLGHLVIDLEQLLRGGEDAQAAGDLLDLTVGEAFGRTPKLWQRFSMSAISLAADLVSWRPSVFA
ncbi:hypothetical protein [Enemella dayhoffiae]|nr:hypothetical protein [Enemella dayhoffiae]